jgi:DNA repair exonuclease SbcCD nuclease subunit
MSDKFIIFSDLHVHNHGSDWRRVDDAIEVLDWIKKEALERDIKDLFFLGDWFHVRGYAYPSIMSRTYKKLLEFKEAGLNMVLLVGNHDMPYKSTTKDNSLTVYNSVFPVVEQPKVWEAENYNFYFLPYVEDKDQLNWAIQKIYSELEEQTNSVAPDQAPSRDGTPKKNVLLAHLDIKDALYQTNVSSNHGVDSKKLSEMFDMVITGHYHVPQILQDNIYYVGSPYQQSFGEADQDKGFIVFDDGEIEYVKNTFSPKYLYVKPTQIDERLRGNYVKIEADNVDNIAAIRAQAEKFSPRNLSITLSQDRRVAGTRVEPNSYRDVKSILKEWVEKNANSKEYNKDKLFEYGVKIIDETKSEE